MRETANQQRHSKLDVDAQIAATTNMNDTDNDGVNDFDDTDSYTSHVAEVILAYDPDPDAYEFTGTSSSIST